jgi:hypothetical protein
MPSRAQSPPPQLPRASFRGRSPTSSRGDRTTIAGEAVAVAGSGKSKTLKSTGRNVINTSNWQSLQGGALAGGLVFLLAAVAMYLVMQQPRNVCDAVIAKAGLDAKPKENQLLLAARVNDIESACLLLNAGKNVNETGG